MSVFARLLHRPSDWAGSLAFLSIAHCPPHTPVPSPLDNTERYHEFRKRWRAPIGNGRAWPCRPQNESQPANAGIRPGA
ncbi:MAG: hypothetical protein J0L59_01440 [Xanthomonadales bacterium]|nr:hypothetical protein [Xanthomonadales bacterium]